MILEILGMCGIWAGAAGLVSVKLKAKLPQVLVAEQKPSNIRDTAKLVIGLLEAGKDWTLGEFQAKHPTGVSIWTANGMDSLAYSTDPAKDARPSRVNHKQPSKEEQAGIWKAYVKLRKSLRDASEREEALSLAARVHEKYGVLGDAGLGRARLQQADAGPTLLDARAEGARISRENNLWRTSVSRISAGSVKTDKIVANQLLKFRGRDAVLVSRNVQNESLTLMLPDSGERVVVPRALLDPPLLRTQYR